MSIGGARVLLTGGAGFLGQHVKNRLIKHGVLEKDITVPRSKNQFLLWFIIT